ncbi:MAG TPA: alpha/beta hydrolase [Micromonospora sp.]
MIERHYVNVPGGQMHYRRAGEGPPVILLHSSPLSSQAMEPWIRALADHMTVFAVDTAGYGQSDPLPIAEPTIDDYARRVVDFADAVGLDRFIVAGTHTGSKIALSVAVQFPERVAQLVMDGLGLYTSEELQRQLDHYTPPIVPNWYGGHLIEAWHRMRSMWIFWPWFNQTAEGRLDESVPPLPELHQMTVDMLRARPDWGLSYRAAFRYDARAALSRLRVPAVLLAKEADPLHEHLDRLKVEAPTLTVRSVANERHLAELAAAFDTSLNLPAPPPPPVVEHRGGTTRRYVVTSHGRVHVRMDGDPSAPPLLFVHGSPGSAESFAPLIEELAKDHLVIAPDTLGNGYSDAPTVADPDIAYFARAYAEALEQLAVGPVAIYGSHTGACIGLELAIARPDLVRSLVADGLPAFDDEVVADILANYWVSLEPERNGEHLLRAWHTIRDAQLWWPWYRDDREHRRPTAPSAPEDLHRLVLEFLKSGPTYRLSYSAAFRYRAAERLPKVQVPTLVCAAPTDMLWQSSQQLVEQAPAVSFVALDAAAGRDAAWAVRHHATTLAER